MKLGKEAGTRKGKGNKEDKNVEKWKEEEGREEE